MKRLLLLAMASACATPPGGGPSKEEAARATADGKADAFDLCAKYGWYGDGECDWFCLEPDPDCDLPPLGPVPSGRPAIHPFVLAHGFDASPTNRWGFNGVAEALEADGHLVFVAIVPPYQSTEARGESLAEWVDRALAESGQPKVNIIAHSMGGLDARHLISGLGYGDRVASLTTISTAHRGTAVADVLLGLLPGKTDALVNALASAWGLTFNQLANDSDVRAALGSLAEANAAAFNQAHPDDPRVHVQSWAGVSSVLGIANPADDDACQGRFLRHEGTSDRMDATLVAVAGVVAHGLELRPNDGIATVESSRWGEFRGCIPADHLDEVGQEGDQGPDRHTGFDHLRFYRNLAFDLAARGF